MISKLSRSARIIAKTIPVNKISYNPISYPKFQQLTCAPLFEFAKISKKDQDKKK